MADKIDEAFEVWSGPVLDEDPPLKTLAWRSFRAGFEACRAAALEALSKQDGGAFDLLARQGGWEHGVQVDRQQGEERWEPLTSASASRPSCAPVRRAGSRSPFRRTGKRRVGAIIRGSTAPTATRSIGL